jgi:hypothetical protein
MGGSYERTIGCLIFSLLSLSTLRETRRVYSLSEEEEMDKFICFLISLDSTKVIHSKNVYFDNYLKSFHFWSPFETSLHIVIIWATNHKVHSIPKKAT